VSTLAAAGCAPGYEGVLCGVCSASYYFESAFKTCEPCGDKGGIQLSLMISIPLVLLIVLLSAVFLSSKVDAWLRGDTTTKAEADETNAATEAVGATNRHGGTGVAGAVNRDGGRVVARSDKNVKDGGESGRGENVQVGSTSRFSSEVFVSSGKAMATYLRTMTKGGAAVSLLKLFAKKDSDEMLVPMVKILLTVFQIVSTMPHATDVIFPPTTRHLFEAMTFVNFAGMNLGSPECYVRVDYVDKLMIQTLAPLAVVGLLLLGYLVDRCRTKPLERGMFVTCFFLITCESGSRWIEPLSTTTYAYTVFYPSPLLPDLVLPGVTTSIFGMFSCDNIDPDGQMPGTPMYLHNDYRCVV